MMTVFSKFKAFVVLLITALVFSGLAFMVSAARSKFAFIALQLYPNSDQGLSRAFPVERFLALGRGSEERDSHNG